MWRLKMILFRRCYIHLRWSCSSEAGLEFCNFVGDICLYKGFSLIFTVHWFSWTKTYVIIGTRAWEGSSMICWPGQCLLHSQGLHIAATLYIRWVQLLWRTCRIKRESLSLILNLTISMWNFFPDNLVNFPFIRIF